MQAPSGTLTASPTVWLGSLLLQPLWAGSARAAALAGALAAKRSQAKAVPVEREFKGRVYGFLVQEDEQWRSRVCGMLQRF
ncbi:hypothetical protein CA264_12855 [Pontibacter actiniarum]|uniref:Uncharacterized protein n=1 Tax=Pontibacter actiniarum TaxID=323450 RepID=A0A1X9YTR3_9BACT|nr:hypothetical protein CA264_12855 [Pontibacter actiniarum]